MRASVISFSVKGGSLAERIRQALAEEGRVTVWALPKYAESNGADPVQESLSDWCGHCWETEDLLIFVGAAGIAVRLIAPWVRDKTTDPAVLVVDEEGRFVLSLLSGHLGGANARAEQLAAALGAVPVITTATDTAGKFAVDVWAKENGLLFSSLQPAKKISAAVLSGEPVGFFCEGTVEGELPPELEPVTEPAAWLAEGHSLIEVSCREYVGSSARENLLRLSPASCVSVGIGCCRGTEAAVIRRKVEEWLAGEGIVFGSLCSIASLDRKSREPGLAACCRAWGLPFVTYSAQELAGMPGDFTASPFVAEVTGVDNVCERAAVRASGGGRLLMRKKAGDGVTAAAACRDWKVYFE